MSPILRRVAVLGGVRIPFARANGAYMEAGNQAMLSAAMTGLVERFELRGAKIGEVAAGAVIKHSRDRLNDFLNGFGVFVHAAGRYAVGGATPRSRL